jgi:hypothetical protein
MSDDLSSPPSGKAKVRFVHAIPQALVATLPKKDTIDVTFSGGDVNAPIANVAVFPRRNFADNYTNSNNSQFAVVDSGRYNIVYRVSGTPGTSPATGMLGLFSNIKLESGKIYTIFARLQFSTTATPVYTTPAPTPAATIITHN